MIIASAETLIARAVASTGLSNFGPAGWRDGFDLLAATMAERDYGDLAGERIEARFTNVLATRLRIEDWIATHPQALDSEIAAPVFVLGLPRTGTTALQAFMVSDPQWRFLRGWEADQPIPPPDLATEHQDPRMLAERSRGDSAQALDQSVHIQETGGPVDDTALLRLNFHNQELGWPAWNYTRWWRDCDMTSTYAYHTRVLKLLQSRRPQDRWVVKAPWHNFHIETLARQYPDATFIMCHRDPAKLIPSVASVVRTVHRSFLAGDAATAEETGAFVLEHLAVSIRRVMQFRQLHGDARFIDVPHSQFTADPFGTLDCIYRKLDAQLAPDARSKLESWLERNRKGAHGEHSYTAEEFGLEAEATRVMFREYIEKFGL